MKPQVYSFVSGKGGVGKTSIASNFAWISSQSRKTVLVDLDLQNQGMTALLRHLGTAGSATVIDLLTAPEEQDLRESCFSQITPTLLFLPASLLESDRNSTQLALFLSHLSAAEKVKTLVRKVISVTDCDVLILDCHGGLDYVSAGAYDASSKTIVVTEPDTVTFNGTLELLDFYRNIVPAAQLASAPTDETEEKAQVLINRIYPRYRFNDLICVYREVLAQLRQRFRVAQSPLALIPQEDFISCYFGDYPFCAELAPNAVFTKKLWLMDYVLSGGNVNAPQCKQARKVIRRGYREKIGRILISNEALNTQRMIAAFGVLAGGVLIYVIALSALLFRMATTRDKPSSIQIAAMSHPIAMAFLCAFATAIVSLGIWNVLRAIWSAQRFFGEKYNFRRRLSRVRGRTSTLGERVISAQTQLIRILMWIPLVTLAILFVEVVIFGVMLVCSVALSKPFLPYLFT